MAIGTVVVVLLWHGTTVDVERSIATVGLVEPFPGRGVHLTTNWRYAIVAAESACIRARGDRATNHEVNGTALLVSVDVTSLEIYRSLLDLIPSFIVPAASPGRIHEMRHVAVTLPAPGSREEWRALKAGFAAPERGSRAAQDLSLMRCLHARSAHAQDTV